MSSSDEAGDKDDLRCAVIAVEEGLDGIANDIAGSD